MISSCKQLRSRGFNAAELEKLADAMEKNN